MKRLSKKQQLRLVIYLMGFINGLIVGMLIGVNAGLQMFAMLW